MRTAHIGNRQSGHIGYGQSRRYALEICRLIGKKLGLKRKTDRLGRLCEPRERREELLDEFERSGLAGAEFATLIGVKYSTFAGWRQCGAAVPVRSPMERLRFPSCLALIVRPHATWFNSSFQETPFHADTNRASMVGRTLHPLPPAVGR